jgi:hypothetical protein
MVTYYTQSDPVLPALAPLWLAFSGQLLEDAAPTSDPHCSTSLKPNSLQANAAAQATTPDHL